MTTQSLKHDVLSKYDINAPRYTSYPTAMQLHDRFTEGDYLDAIKRSNLNNKPLSLYVHIPFCKSLCYYCACNKIVSPNQSISRDYLQSTLLELKRLATLFSKDRSVLQLHWGGGTPTFLSDSEMTELIFHIGKNFRMLGNDDSDFSIELDPRDLNQDRIALIGGLGFNRVSLGIQDFDEKVQRAINRVQPESTVTKVMSDLRDYGFRSINMDLIYGLPHQNKDSFKTTISKVIELQPERLSIFNYAHLPQRFKAQKLITAETLPGPDEKQEMFHDTTQQLIEAGYVYIGMDHFAKKNDNLAIAQRTGDLHRNFQGYTLHKDLDLIGIGVSAISQIDNTICQNVKTVSEYQRRVDVGQPCIELGITLTEDDEIRKWTIMNLICHYHVEFSEFTQLFNHNFHEYFTTELTQLEILTQDRLLCVDTNRMYTINGGNQIIRYICMAFDRYNETPVNNGGNGTPLAPQFSRIM